MEIAKMDTNNQKRYSLLKNFHSFQHNHQLRSRFSPSFAFVNKKNQFENEFQNDEFLFLNYAFDKGRLKSIVLWFFEKHGHYKTLKFLEKLKEFGFGFATNAGISLGIDDLKIPDQKIQLLAKAETKAAKDFSEYRNGKITGIEKVQRFIYTWNQTNDTLKQEVVKHFEKTDLFNPIYMMAFSGARGNMSQVRQLVGMRGLMADPQGQIIDFPIQSNFREGLTLTEYLISTYGARKGIVDTALRTATAGYLTRRLVDVAQHTIVSHFDCGTMRGIFLFDMKEGKKTIYSFQNRLIGRVLAQDIEFQNMNLSKNAFRNQEIDSKLAKAIANITKKAFVRSPLTCETARFVCQLCYGWSFSHGKLVSVGEAVGIIAAQSIGEPGTQLTMRTFHTGGVFAGGLTDQILAPFHGKIQYFQSIPGSCVRISLNEIAFFTKMPGSFLLQKNNMFGIQPELSNLVSSATTNEKFAEFQQKFKLQKKHFQFSEVFRIPAYALLFCRHNESVEKRQVLAQFSSVLQKVQYGSAEQTLFSPFAGEFVFGKTFFKQKKKLFLSDFSSSKTTRLTKNSTDQSKIQNFLFEKRNGDFSELELKYDNFWKSQNWSTIWILAGKIFFNSFDTKFWLQEGDLVKKSSVVTRILWKKNQNFQYSLLSTKNSRFSSVFQKSKQQKEKNHLYLLSLSNSQKFDQRSFSTNSSSVRTWSKFSQKSFQPFFLTPKTKAKKMVLKNSKKLVKIVQKKDRSNLFLLQKKLQKLQSSLTRKQPEKKKIFPNEFFQRRFFETKKVFSFVGDMAFKDEQANDIVFFQNKSNRFFTNFQKIQLNFQKSKHLAHMKKTQKFFQSCSTPEKNSLLFSKNVFNLIFLKFAKKKKKDIFSSFLKNSKYSNVFRNSRKFGFFSFLFNERFLLNKDLQKFFLKNTVETFRTFCGLKRKKQTQTFHKIFQKQKTQSLFTSFSFPKFEKNCPSVFKHFERKKTIQEFSTFRPLKKRTEKNLFQKFSTFSQNNIEMNKTFSKNILCKKILFRVSVEKIRYKNFGYISSFCGFVQNQFFQNSFRTFTTLQQMQKGFDQNIFPGKSEQNFCLPHENFFGKPFPTFLSSSFFQHFQTQTSGLFFVTCFETSAQFFENFLCFDSFKSFPFESLSTFHYKTEFCTVESRQENQNELENFSPPISYFQDIFHFHQSQFEFLKTIKNMKRRKFFFFSSISKIFLVQIDTFSFLSIAIFSYLRYVYMFHEEKLSNCSFSNLAEIFESEKKPSQIFQIQKQKFLHLNLQSLFPSFCFFHHTQTFFLSNFSQNNSFNSLGFQTLQQKYKNMLVFQSYNQELFWLPQENFWLSTTEIRPFSNQFVQPIFNSISSQNNDTMFFLPKNTSFLNFVNRQGKKQKTLFQFASFGRVSNIDEFENSSFESIFSTRFSKTEHPKKMQKYHQIQQKLSFSKKRKDKSFQKNLGFLFQKRTSAKDFQKIQKIFLNPSLSSKNSFDLLFGIEKTTIPNISFKTKNFLKKQALFSNMEPNQLFTCFPLKIQRSPKKSSNFPKNSKPVQNSLFHKKLHLKVQSGWFYIPFVSLSFFDFQKICFNRGSFFGKNLSFEQNTIFSETVVLSFPSLFFGNIQIAKNLKSAFQKKVRKKTNQVIFFSAKSVEKNTKCRYSSSFCFVEKIQKIQNASPFQCGPKKRVVQFFRPFEYKLLENEKNAQKLFQNFEIQSFSVFFSSNTYIELYKRYHSSLLNFSSMKFKKNQFFMNQILKNALNPQIEYISNFENLYSLQNKVFSEESFISIQNKDSFDFQKQKIEQENFKKSLEQKKKNSFKKYSFPKDKKKVFFQFFQKTWSTFEFTEKQNFFDSFGIHKKMKDSDAILSFYPIQFRPFLVLFSKTEDFSNEKKSINNSKTIRQFPSFSKNSLKNTIEYCIYEKKASFFHQKFGFLPFSRNFFKSSFFWLNKDKVNFVFPFEKSSTNFTKSSVSRLFFEKRFRNSQTGFFQNSIFSNNQEFYGSTKIWSPYNGEILSMATHEMNWWEKASKISTLQKLEKLFTIVPKKDLFAVEFPLKEENRATLKNLPNSKTFECLKRKQKNFSRLYETVLFSQKQNFGNFETHHLSLKKTNTSSFVTKYENKVYTFQKFTVGYPNLSKMPKIGNFVSYGDCFFNSALRKPGQILHLNSKKMTCRSGQPFLVSLNGIFHFSKIPYIRKNVPVVTLPYQTVQAGDIVQGIPKVEQFFEARTTIQGRLFVSSLPILLKGIFERYKVFLPLEQATRQSFLKIQQILVDGVQRVYRSQGVSITDKHLEIVVRQMTTKVQILYGAQTGFFPGELVSLDLVERLNKFFMVKIRYEPIILGITRSSLEVESFLSASSFQQTTKILSLAAISQKRDFLKGLKENLLVGNLIPAGTGYFHLTKNK